MKKYIPVFGPQELFNGVPEYVEFIRFNDYSRDYLWGDSNSINHLGFKDLKAIPIVAMRRIEEAPGSQLVTDGMPSFYVGSSGVCTHKMAESDIPVWCNDVDDTCTAMGFINDCLRLTRKPKLWTVEDQKVGRLPEVGCVVIGCDKKEYEVLAQERCELALRNTSNRNLMLVTVSGFNRDFKPIETPEEKAGRLEGEFVDSIMRDEHEPGMSDEAKEWAIHVLKCAYRKLSDAAHAKDGE